MPSQTAQSEPASEHGPRHHRRKRDKHRRTKEWVCGIISVAAALAAIALSIWLWTLFQD